MPIDPNIALSVQPAKFENPLDVEAKGLNISRLSTENEQSQLELQKTKATLQSQIALQNQKMQLDKVTMMHNIATQISTGISSQQDLDQKDALAQQLGLPSLKQKLGNTYDATPDSPFQKSYQQLQVDTLSAKDKLDYAHKVTDDKLKERGLNIRERELGAKRGERSDANQNKYVGQVEQILESARGNPAVSQAEKDLYAASKFDSLFNLYGDANKLNPQQVQLAASEVAKIASGGVPTIHELQGLNPNNLPKALASAAQTFTAKPVAANQGAFVGALKDYVNSLKDDGKQVILDKYGRVLDANRKRIGESEYGRLKDIYLNRFLTPSTLKANQNFDKDVVDYAKTHGISNEEAQSVKEQRTQKASN